MFILSGIKIVLKSVLMEESKKHKPIELNTFMYIKGLGMARKLKVRLNAF